MNATTNPNKALWEKGDFTRLAATMRESGDELVEALGITRGLKVLDLGCGDGTTALPLAKRGADVLGVDIASNLVAAGRRRAQEAGLEATRVDHGLGVYSVYLHLSEIRVTPGQMLEKGELLGLAGATGRVTGPHLHWGVRIQDARVDPFSLLEL